VEAVTVGAVGWMPVGVREEDVGFEAVYEAERRALLRLAFALTGQLGAAEDLTQEAFLRLHQRWDRVSRYDRPGAWVRRVLVNLATSRARRLTVETRTLARLGRERSPAVRLDGEGTEFWAAVRTLPRRQAQAIALYYLDDRTTADIAAILGCAEATVRIHLHRGREALRERLRPDKEHR
jgi:RNA polymerase sigma-70 factor (ECF subfamily)